MRTTGTRTPASPPDTTGDALGAPYEFTVGIAEVAADGRLDGEDLVAPADRIVRP